MVSTTCAVHVAVHHTEKLDGMPDLLDAPTSIKEQMPALASLLQQLAANMGRDFVEGTVRAAMDVRKAYDVDDYRAVSMVYRRGNGWMAVCEGGYQLGVPEGHMQTFAQRHRSKNRAH